MAVLRSGPLPTTEIGHVVLELVDAVGAGQLGRPRALGGAQRPRQEGQVLGDREEDGAVDAQALDDLDLEGDGAGDVTRVPGDLAVALEGVHVAHVDAAAGDLHRADEDRARAHRVDVHVAVGLVALDLLGRHREAVRRADEEGAEVARVVGVGDRRRGRRAELAHEGPQARGQRDEVVRGEAEDRVLRRAVGQGCEARGVAGEALCLLAPDGDAQAARLVEGDRVAVREGEGRRVGAAVGAAHALGPDPLHARLGPLGPAARAHGRAVGVAVEAPLHRQVVARARRHRGHFDVADADRDGVAHLGAGDRHRRRDLVAAADRRRDHRTPAARCRVDHDVAAVGHRSRHRDVGPQEAVGERLDEDRAVGLGRGRGRLGGGHAWTPSIRLSPGHRRDERELLARAQRAIAPGMDAGDDGQG